MGEPSQIVERVEQMLREVGLGAARQLPALPRGSLAIVVVFGGEPQVLVPLGRQFALDARTGDLPGFGHLGVARVNLRLERLAGRGWKVGDVVGRTARVAVSLPARPVRWRPGLWLFRLLHRS